MKKEKTLHIITILFHDYCNTDHPAPTSFLGSNHNTWKITSKFLDRCCLFRKSMNKDSSEPTDGSRPEAPKNFG